MSIWLARPNIGLLAAILVVLAIWQPGAYAQTSPEQVRAGIPSATTPASNPSTSKETLVVRVEQAAPLKLERGESKSIWEVILPPIISALTALGGAFIGGQIGLRSSAATINQKANEIELKELRSKLGEFYGPLRQRSEDGRLMADELRDRQPDKDTFRLLVKLLDPEWLRNASPSDRTIVSEIVQNGTEVLKLIREKAGAVDPAVSPYLTRAATHFTMLKLAKDGALDNDAIRFERYAFPWQLDDVVAAEVKRLSERADLLQSRPSEAHPPISALTLAKTLSLKPWPSPPIRT